MAGYTDLAFRSLALTWGADFAFTEMISAEALRRGNRKTLRLAERAPNETTFGIQIFASEPESAAAAVAALLPYGAELFDLNCGCSVPKIIKSGAGALLLKDPRRIGDIIRAMADAGAPGVSVKLRLGWDAHSLTYLESAEEAVKNGACLVSLHPRTRAQGFTGHADWSHITVLKKQVSVPVIGSGDLATPEDAERMLGETGCDGIMFARGAIGNPFIFRETRHLLEHGTRGEPPGAAVRLTAALSHLDLLAGIKPEIVAAREMRKHFAHYAKGLPEAAAFRREINTAATVDDYRRIVQAFLDRRG
jgi:tRNA-dihydrouridine synthase B